MDNRVEALDWLRGLAAVSIMLGHLFQWLYFNPSPGHVIHARVLVYGVSVFFILSGLSMAIAYSEFIVCWRSSCKFIVRRVFRILPLLWICVALVVILQRWEISPLDILASATLATGFYYPSGHIVRGAWSLGCEAFFYVLTPAVIVLYNHRKLYGELFTAMSLAVYLAFAFWFLDADSLFSTQREIYRDPLNHLFLYCAGISIYYNLRDRQFGARTTYAFILLPAAAFTLLPAWGFNSTVITGGTRLTFTAICILVVIGFYKFSDYERIPRGIAYALGKFGVATYGVYILHPIVYDYLALAVDKTQRAALFAGTIALTTSAALLSFYFFETRMIALGKRLTPSRPRCRTDNRPRQRHNHYQAGETPHP